MNLRSHFGQTCSFEIFRSVAWQKTHALRVGLSAMPSNEPESTQETRPKKGDPVEIPIPTRHAVLRDLMKVAPPALPPKAPTDADDAD